MISPNTGLILLLLSSITFGFSHGQDTELVEESCLPNGGDLFSLFSTPVTFDEAQTLCTNLEGNLARISSKEEFNHVETLISSPTFDFWIGVKDSASGRTGTGRFSFVDGINDNLSFINTTVGKFPWNSSEPNDFDDADEFCVEWLKDDNHWNDQVCSDKNGFICRSSCPPVEQTSEPTQSPTTLAPTSKESSEGNVSTSSIALLSIGGISSVGLGICITLVLKEKKKFKSLTADLLKVKVAQI